MKTKTLSAPGIWSGDRPQGGAKGVWLKKACFGELVPEDVIGKPCELTNADYGFLWRVKKDEMEVATGGTWTQREWGPRTLQLRKYLRELCAIFVDDRPFHSDSLYKHANVQSKAVFSHAMTALDKILGWIDEERWVGSKFAACMWIYTKGVLTE